MEIRRTYREGMEWRSYRSLAWGALLMGALLLACLAACGETAPQHSRVKDVATIELSLIHI